MARGQMHLAVHLTVPEQSREPLESRNPAGTGSMAQLGPGLPVFSGTSTVPPFLILRGVAISEWFSWNTGVEADVEEQARP